MSYHIDRPLVIPAEWFKFSVRPEALAYLDGKTTGGRIAELLIRGSQAGKQWRVLAHAVGESADVVALVGSMWTREGMAREDVLPAAEEWVRTTYAAGAVVGSVVEIPIDGVRDPHAQPNKLCVDGLLLVCKS